MALGCRCWQSLAMNDYPKYMRLVLDVEIEVMDPISAKTFTFDSLAEGGMLNQSSEQHLASLVSSLLAQQLAQRVSETGVRLMVVSGIPRFIAEDGSYAEMTLPAMPRRLDDGTEAWPDGVNPLE